jgi:hypothetical protein
MEISDPAGPAPVIRQITPASLVAFELEIFNGYLYVGGGDKTTGYTVWKTNATGSVPYQFAPVALGEPGGGQPSRRS